MKRNSVLSLGLMALALMISACTDSMNPTSSAVGGQTNDPSGDPGILARLHDPQVSISATEAGMPPRLLFTAGASGTVESESMTAARTVESVVFEIRQADNSVVDRASTSNIMTTGVLGPDRTASLTVFADSQWDSVEPLGRGAYLLGIIRGSNGEVLVTRAEIEYHAGS